MTRIIGHRGAAGLALENSAESIRAALKHDVDAVEFDIHLTKDKKLIVIHDAHTGRVSPTKVRIKDATLDELRNLPLHNGQTLPTLDEIMDIIGSKPVVIDIKDAGSAAELLQVLKRHPRAHVSFASFQHDELRFLHERLPKIPIYVLEHLSPIDIIHSAVNLRAQGIGLNKWLMNPLTYFFARRYHLELYVYTVNNRFLGLILKKLYPDVTICTDHPQRFVDLHTPSSGK